MQAAERIDDYLGMLNPAQRQAAEYGTNSPDAGFGAGPLLVIAGAGTGKTMTLAHRVAHLVIKGVAPERILLLTFAFLAGFALGAVVAKLPKGDAKKR